MSGTAPLRVLVCGTNFGRFYAEAVQTRPGYVLAGILSRGSAVSRACARRFGVPHYTDVTQLPDDVDAACVVVGASISGGEGTELATALIGRGIHVLQEHPVHLDEMTRCLKLARRHHVQYRVNTHYPHVEPVRQFIAATQRLTERQKPLFLDAATPVHLMYPMVDILGRALGSLRPWQFGDVSPSDAAVGPQPFRTLHGRFGGVPLTLRVQNQLDPSDRDNHALHWHRLSLGTEGGVLTLADTHGPLLWSPRLHVRRDTDHRFVLDGPDTDNLGFETTSVVGRTGSFRGMFGELWPQGIGLALDGLRQAIEEKADALAAAQYDLTVCRIWSDLAARLGPPEIVRPAAPRPLPVSDLFPDLGAAETPRPSEHPPPEGGPPAAPAAGAVDDGNRLPYDSSAEFFDLVAAEHTATASATAVAAVLADADLSHGPVVDVGAGTGLVTEAVARARPDAEILACEPATGMRAVLTSRVFSDPELRQRVTVTADTAPELDLPDSVSAVLLCGVLGHLDTAQRARLWNVVLERLAPEGIVVVELMGLERPVAIPEARTATARAGRNRYEWWFSGAPDEDDPSAMQLHTTWRVYRENEQTPLRQVHDSYRWIPFGLSLVAQESGLHAQPLDTRTGAPPLAVLTRRPAVPDLRSPLDTKEYR